MSCCIHLLWAIQTQICDLWNPCPNFSVNNVAGGRRANARRMLARKEKKSGKAAGKVAGTVKMAKLIIEGSATLSSEKVFGMTNAQALLSAEIFVSDTAPPMPEGMTTAQRNQWLLDQMRDKLVVYMRSEVARLSTRKKVGERMATIDAEIAIETNF